MKIPTVYEFNFPGRPMSKDNEKIFNRQGRVFTSKKFKDYENYLRLSAKSQFMEKPIDGPISLRLTFYFKNKVRPDLTNLPKSVCDAMNGVVWKDDKQITECFLEARISDLEGVAMSVSTSWEFVEIR